MSMSAPHRMTNQGAFYDGKSVTVTSSVKCLGATLAAAGVTAVGSLQVYSGEVHSAAKQCHIRARRLTASHADLAGNRVVCWHVACKGGYSCRCPCTKRTVALSHLLPSRRRHRLPLRVQGVRAAAAAGGCSAHCCCWCPCHRVCTQRDRPATLHHAPRHTLFFLELLSLAFSEPLPTSYPFKCRAVASRRPLRACCRCSSPTRLRGP